MTRLVTSQDIKDRTQMGGNVDSDKFIHFIDDVQIFQLEPVLGTKLYDKILTDFASNSLTGLYEQMYNDYIKDVVCHGVFAEYVKLGAIIVGNGGIYNHVAQDAEVISAEERSNLAQRSNSRVDSYIARLVRFLCDQDANIPEYTLNQDNDYDIDPVTNMQTISGWYLGNNEREYDWRIAPSSSSGDGFIQLED